MDTVLVRGTETTVSLTQSDTKCCDPCPSVENSNGTVAGDISRNQRKHKNKRDKRARNKTAAKEKREKQKEDDLAAQKAAQAVRNWNEYYYKVAEISPYDAARLPGFSKHVYKQNRCDDIASESKIIDRALNPRHN